MGRARRGYGEGSPGRREERAVLEAHLATRIHEGREDLVELTGCVEPRRAQVRACLDRAGGGERWQRSKAPDLSVLREHERDADMLHELSRAEGRTCSPSARYTR